jgi:hypothetical protein
MKEEIKKNTQEYIDTIRSMTHEERMNELTSEEAKWMFDFTGSAEDWIDANGECWYDDMYDALLEAQAGLIQEYGIAE